MSRNDAKDESSSNSFDDDADVDYSMENDDKFNIEEDVDYKIDWGNEMILFAVDVKTICTTIENAHSQVSHSIMMPMKCAS